MAWPTSGRGERWRLSPTDGRFEGWSCAGPRDGIGLHQLRQVLLASELPLPMLCRTPSPTRASRDHIATGSKIALARSAPSFFIASIAASEPQASRHHARRPVSRQRNCAATVASRHTPTARRLRSCGSGPASLGTHCHQPATARASTRADRTACVELGGAYAEPRRIDADRAGPLTFLGLVLGGPLTTAPYRPQRPDDRPRILGSTRSRPQRPMVSSRPRLNDQLALAPGSNSTI